MNPESILIKERSGTILITCYLFVTGTGACLLIYGNPHPTGSLAIKMALATKLVHTTKEHLNSLSRWTLDERVESLVDRTCFSTFRGAKFPMTCHLPLLNSLLRLYDVDMHFFDFGNFKLLFSLEDILMITGLPIDGKPVTGEDKDPQAVCEAYLGMSDGAFIGKNKTIAIQWLKTRFEVVPADADDHQLLIHARAYILYTIGVSIFAEPTPSYVPAYYLPLLNDIQEINSYAWGAALYAHLHVHLKKCKTREQVNISGFVTPLIYFAVERIPKALRFLMTGAVNGGTDEDLNSWLPMQAPLFVGWSYTLHEAIARKKNKIRFENYNEDIFPKLSEDDIIWQPYLRLNREAVPGWFQSQLKMTLTSTTTLCFEKAAVHRPQLVPGQYGLPEDGFNDLKIGRFNLKVKERKGVRDYVWESHGKYVTYNADWDARAENLISIDPPLLLQHLFPVTTPPEQPTRAQPDTAFNNQPIMEENANDLTMPSPSDNNNNMDYVSESHGRYATYNADWDARAEAETEQHTSTQPDTGISLDGARAKMLFVEVGGDGVGGEGKVPQWGRFTGRRLRKEIQKRPTYPSSPPRQKKGKKMIMDSMAQVEGPAEIASEDPSQVSQLGGEENLLPPVYHFPESASSKKKLLVLDVNGILADIVSHSSKKNYIKIVGQKMVFMRPSCAEFLKFCFATFEIGVWSSRKWHNLSSVIDALFDKKSKGKLLFIFDQTHCTDNGLKTLKNEDKPLFLKEIKVVWNAFEEYNATNTLLVDDSPYKALKNPAHTSIFPKSYNHMDANDFSLGDNGDLRMYLKDLANAPNVQDYVRQHPFGQPAITRADKNWNFYSHKILADSTYGQKNEKDAIGQA
ncbi:uncharacterized protein LOC120015610 isoform X2 [Tripterygium wilfordii]|uniref:uncharacterized protein LOC120015610 isoform X2 n=1 Tax=Tripterygium wilfordii TaxID=458696 RepID=UPI0018F81E82|nr:uncharacterized protein LOC120015610 isoform X2 [Tripterygium wilfordii]